MMSMFIIVLRTKVVSTFIKFGQNRREWQVRMKVRCDKREIDKKG
jgi:hypothetical protein